MLAVAIATACTTGDDTALGRAEDAMAALEDGRVTVTLEVGTGGFRLAGEFSAGDGDLPAFDFEYTDLAGDVDDVRIASDGETVVVAEGDRVQQLTGADASQLALGGRGFVDLGVASWVDAPDEATRGTTIVVTGRVDVVDLLTDLSRLASALTDAAPLDGDGAQRLAQLVQRSHIEVVIDAGDLPTSIEAEIDFGRRVPDAFGPHAAERLVLTIELQPLGATQ